MLNSCHLFTSLFVFCYHIHSMERFCADRTFVVQIKARSTPVISPLGKYSLILENMQ